MDTSEQSKENMLNKIGGTEKIQALTNLNESEQRYKTLFESAAEGILVADIEEKKFLYANPAICKMLGYSEKELTSMHVHDIHLKEDLPRILDDFRARTKGEKTLSVDIPCLCKDGSVKYFFINSTRVVLDSKQCMVGFFTDVTKLKKTQQELDKIQKHLRLILDYSFDGINIVEFDIKTHNRRLIFANDRYVEMSGRSREELIAIDNLNKFVRYDVPCETITKWRKSVVDMVPYKGRASWIRPDGKENYYEWAAAPTKIDGRYYIVGIDRDITEQIKNHEKLQKAEKRYRTLFEGTLEGIIVVDAETEKILYVNPAICRMLGYSEKELITMGVRDVHPKEQLDMVLAGFRAQANGVISLGVDIPCLCKDGSIKYAYINSTPTVLDSRKCLVGFFTDVTELKKTRNELDKIQNHLQIILDNSFDGINICEFSHDIKKRRLVFCNNRYVEMAGRTREELMAAENLNDFVNNSASEEIRRSWYECIINRIPFRGQASWIRLDGKENYYEWAATPMIIDGRYYVVGVDRDITERQKAGRELEKIKKDLETRILQRTRDLENLNKHLRSLAGELSLAEERMRRRIAVDVHDNIGQNLGLARIKLQALMNSPKAESLQEDLQSISNLILQMIESARTMTFEISPPVLYELGFDAAVEWLLRQSRDRNGLLTDFVSDGETTKLAENVKVFLYQAVRELLVNVTKHAKAKHVDVSIKRVDNELCVCVADDGEGFDVEKRALEMHNISSGFGLFSIRERIRLLNGNLDIQSKQDYGTKVTLTVPLVHKRYKKRIKK